MAIEVEVEVKRRRFTVDEYHRMLEAGILREGERIELIRGELVQKMGIGPSHVGCVSFLIERLVLRLVGRALLSPGGPIVILPDSEPEPDITLLKPRADFYRRAHPRPEDVLLVIEVADSSRRFDRNVKRPLYAEAAIAEYWIVDLVDELVEVHLRPEGGASRHVERIGRGRSVSPQAFPDVVLAVDEILGD
jgi:Uma2 family endonuclease